MLVYITDSASTAAMGRFWDMDMRSQNNKEVMREWIGGEYYIQTSLYLAIKDRADCVVVESDKVVGPADVARLTDLLVRGDCIIVPGWTEVPTFFAPFRDKIVSYAYQGQTHCPCLPPKQVATPWRQGECSFIPITPIPLPDVTDDVPFFDGHQESGLLVGKCLSHVSHKGLSGKVLSFVRNLPAGVFAHMRNLQASDVPDYIPNKEAYLQETKELLSCDKINNLGILNPRDFRLLLRKVKYVLFIHTAWCPPTLIEALSERCIVISDRAGLPEDLQSNPNIYVLDDMTEADTYDLIRSIESGDTVFKDEGYPSDHTAEGKIRCIQRVVEECRAR